MDKRKANGRKKGKCQAIKDDGKLCGRKCQIKMRDVSSDERLLFVRVRVCGKCWEGEK